MILSIISTSTPPLTTNETIVLVAIIIVIGIVAIVRIIRGDD
jgi:hypothetical protein